MSGQVYSTTAAAYLVGIDPRSFARWARRHGITPVGRERIGRSFITWWSWDDLKKAAEK